LLQLGQIHRDNGELADAEDAQEVSGCITDRGKTEQDRHQNQSRQADGRRPPPASHHLLFCHLNPPSHRHPERGARWLGPRAKVHQGLGRVRRLARLRFQAL